MVIKASVSSIKKKNSRKNTRRIDITKSGMILLFFILIRAPWKSWYQDLNIKVFYQLGSESDYWYCDFLITTNWYDFELDFFNNYSIT